MKSLHFITHIKKRKNKKKKHKEQTKNRYFVSQGLFTHEIRDSNLNEMNMLYMLQAQVVLTMK